MGPAKPRAKASAASHDSLRAPRRPVGAAGFGYERANPESDLEKATVIATRQDPAPRPLTAWALTTGEAGMRTQARGVAGAVAEVVVEKIVRLKPLWRRAPAGTPFLLSGLDPASDPLAPPWPDLVVSCGRRAGAVAIALKRRLRGALVAVHVQDPQASPRPFDLVVAMAHDRVQGPNVLRLQSAMHDVTPERLAAAAAAWAPRFAHLPRPYAGVILGGSTAKTSFEVADAQRLHAGLRQQQQRTGGAALIVPSRRTPADVQAYFREQAEQDPGVWMWSGAGDNPYLGVLALADRLVVTADSVSMVSEALATPHPVEVFMLELGRRHSSFIDGLCDRGLVRRFTGELGPETPRPVLDATADAAAATRRILEARGFRP